ncbi:3677_t:CDS:1, partial [Dentiscutata heterogama]
HLDASPDIGKPSELSMQYYRTLFNPNCNCALSDTGNHIGQFGNVRCP